LIYNKPAHQRAGFKWFYFIRICLGSSTLDSDAHTNGSTITAIAKKTTITIATIASTTVPGAYTDSDGVKT
jgi:hypothetical protein